MALSLGGGSRLQEGNINMKVKQTPAMRKRMKKMKEKALLAAAGGPTRDIVVAPHGKNLDYFRLKNPAKTSASSRDPRPGALPQFDTPYYHPKDSRLPESLEDKLKNTEAEDDEEHEDGYVSLENYTQEDLVPPQEDTDNHAWRRSFLGGKKIKFDDAQDTESEADSQALDDAPDDFEFSVGESVGGLSEEGDGSVGGDMEATGHDTEGVVGSDQLESPHSSNAPTSPGAQSQGAEVDEADSPLTASLAEKSSTESATNSSHQMGRHCWSFKFRLDGRRAQPPGRLGSDETAPFPGG